MNNKKRVIFARLWGHKVGLGEQRVQRSQGEIRTGLAARGIAGWPGRWSGVREWQVEMQPGEQTSRAIVTQSLVGSGGIWILLQVSWEELEAGCGKG